MSSSHFNCKVSLLISGDLVPQNPLMRRVESTNDPKKSFVVCDIQSVNMLSMLIATESESMVMLLE